MNPKGVNDLDPKLRETYERIMGTTPGATSSNQAPAAPINQPPHPILETHPEAAVTSAAQSFINPTPSAIPNPQIIKPNDPFKETVPPPPEIITKNAVVGDPGKKKTNLIPLILALIVVIFFIFYAVFWAKIFNLF
jgi:hypothetical protein